MRLKIERNGICIFPENIIEEAYIEDTLGLKKEGDCIKLIRSDALDCIDKMRLNHLTTDCRFLSKKLTDKLKLRQYPKKDIADAMADSAKEFLEKKQVVQDAIKKDKKNLSPRDNVSFYCV